MANRYWVGNSGVWSDNTNHWSASTGGAPNASLPTSSDNVYFDASSFTEAEQTVTVDALAYCLSMDWTGATNTPTFGGGYRVNIYGSLTFIAAMTSMHTSGLLFKGTGNITTNGKTVTSYISITTGATSYTLQDNLIVSGNSGLFHRVGTFNTNNKTINAKRFYCDGAANRTLTLGSSIITCSGNITFTTTGLTMTANTSTIIMTGNTKTFAGGGVTFNNVEFQGTPITVNGSNTFSDLKLTAGKTVNFTAETTQTVTTLSGAGAAGNLITIQSVTAGTAFTISKASGTVNVVYWSIKDSTATGGAVFNAFLSNGNVNVSGNTGWNFTAAATNTTNFFMFF